MRRVGRVVLDPDLAQPEPLGQPIGADQRRDPGGERRARRLLERQEVDVAPDVLWAGLDATPRPGGIEPGEVVGDLERPEAGVADVAGLERVLGMTFLALERLGGH